MKKQKKRINNTVDLILLILFLLVSIYFIVEMFIGKIIPIKYILIISIVLLLIFILTFNTYKVRNETFRFIRKAYLIVLSILLVLGSLFQGQLRSAFSNVDDGSTSKSLMYVVTLNDSEYQKIEDIESIGYGSSSNSLTIYSLEQLSKYSFEKMTYDSVSEEFEALENKEVDAILLSAQDQAFSKNNDENYSKKYKTIYTIEMTIKNEHLDVSNVNIVNEPFVVYLSGMDDMGEPTYNALSDVNMLLMVDPVHHHLEMISINRDTYVPNTEYDEYPDKLTHLGWYGPSASEKVLERIFGIQIDYFAKVTFESLIKIIDTMGGIDVDVKISFTEQDENRSFAEEDLIHLEAGYQHLNGKQTLAYARHRHTEGWDVAGREQAQRDIVSAVVKRMLSVEGALKVGDVMNVAASYVSTNLPLDSAKAFVKNAIDKGTPWTFGSSTINSAYEFVLPCAMENGQYRNAVLLQESDILRVYSLYKGMYEELNLHDFEFDLNELKVNVGDFKFDPYVITKENYYDVVPTYFPEYVVYGLD